MAETTVYRWRLPTTLRERLERAAAERDVSLAELLRRIAEDWLERTAPQEDARLREARRHALAACGTIASGDPDLASRAREVLRARLQNRL